MSAQDLGRFAFGLLSPLSLTLLLGLAALLAGWKGKRRWGLGLGAASIALLWILSTPAFAQVLGRALENGLSATPVAALPQADAILVLGGTLTTPAVPERPTLVLGRDAQRLWHAAELYSVRKAPLVVISSGRAPGREGDPPEADSMELVLKRLGVPGQALVLERDSSDTVHNARNTLPIMRRHGVRKVLLVTSGLHMPRALRTFEREWRGSGIDVIPAIADQVQPQMSLISPSMWIPSLPTLVSVTLALKEFAGMVGLALI